MTYLSLWEFRALSRLWQRSCLGVSESWRTDRNENSKLCLHSGRPSDRQPLMHTIVFFFSSLTAGDTNLGKYLLQLKTELQDQKFHLSPLRQVFYLQMGGVALINVCACVHTNAEHQWFLSRVVNCPQMMLFETIAEWLRSFKLIRSYNDDLKVIYRLKCEVIGLLKG